MFSLRVIGGTHRQGKKVLAPGDVFTSEDPLHETFKNKFELIDEIREPEKEEAGDEDTPAVEDDKEVEASFELKPLKNGWFDVVNSETGKALNAKRLREDDAKDLLASLEN